MRCSLVVRYNAIQAAALLLTFARLLTGLEHSVFTPFSHSVRVNSMVVAASTTTRGSKMVSINEFRRLLTTKRTPQQNNVSHSSSFIRLISIGVVISDNNKRLRMVSISAAAIQVAPHSTTNLTG